MDGVRRWRIGDAVEPRGELPPGIREVWPAGVSGTVVDISPEPADDPWLTVRVLQDQVRVAARYLQRA
jgi:hypothetical protein